MAMPAIRVEGLGKRYRLAHGEERAPYRTLRDSIMNFVTAPLRKRGTVEEFWALSDVSFEVQPGEVVGIIGRNGAGKSTLLKILSRITKPTTGRVEINGRVGSLLEVGTGFHPELTGRENIYLNGSILGMSHKEIAKKFDEIVAFAEVEKFLDTPVKRYSSGMYMRLAFAVAAHLEPEILIVDEVLAVGDATFQKKCLGKMSDLASCGRTILFVSHQMSAIQSLCSHAVLMEGGRIRNEGPKTPIIAEYIASARSTLAARAWLELNVEEQSTGTCAKFTALRVGNEVVESAHQLFPDGPAEFDVRVRATEAINPLYLSIALHDRYDTRLVCPNTHRSRIPLRATKGDNVFRLRIESLHLTPGTYRVELWLADDKVVLDSIPNAAQIAVSDYAPDSTELTLGLDGIVTCHFSAFPLPSRSTVQAEW